jgi:type IV secretion system protein TrbJ
MISISRKRSRYKVTLLSALTAVSLTLGTISPAHALLGLPSVVFDPSNLAQNVLTAARTLAMINNQIRQLTNEAQMLLRLDKQLLQLGYNVAPQLKADLDQLKVLMQAAQSIAYTVRDTENTFATLFPQDYTAAITSHQLLIDARRRWELSRKAWRDTMVVQARIVETLPMDIQKLDELVAESQGAQGQLQATQAGNQITAMNTKQQIQLQQLMAAQFRADAIQKARDTQAQEQARETFKRFLGRDVAYH